ITVKTDGSSAIEPITNLRAEADDKYIMLKWNKPQQSNYAYYNIYRKAKGTSSPFVTVNEYPYSFSDQSTNPDVLFSDSLQNNTTVFQYYIQAMSNFGLLTSPSDTIEAKGKPRPLPTKPFIEKIEEENTGQQLITWSISAEFAAKIQYFWVRRAEEREGEFIKVSHDSIVCSGNVLEYSYLDMLPLGTAYYAVIAIDENGNELYSIPKMAQIADATPPAKPIGISGTVDLDGLADVTWTENSESDLLGYILFFSNNRNGEYIPMTQKWESSAHFNKIVNIESLTEEIWVKVAAIDYHHNRSALSDPYRLSLPDIIPPSAPVLLRVDSRPTCVYIKWEASSSEDVVRHEVQRKSVNYEDDWHTIASFQPIWRVDTSYCDTSQRCWVDYEYRIKAIDDADLFSYSSKGTGMLTSSFCYKGVYNPRAFFSALVPHPRKTAALRTSKGFVCIYWEFPCDYPVYEFHIYRRLSPTGPFVLVKSIKPHIAIFTSYFTVPDPTDPSKLVTYGHPNSTKANVSTIMMNDGVSQSTSPSGAALNPKKSKVMSNDICSYLIEDDDLAIISSNLNDIEYMIQAEFSDGTRSTFSDKIKP
ncbi:MAG: hypothetical protein ACOYOA_16785, partial [Saprospiraceae bacterium]